MDKTKLQRLNEMRRAGDFRGAILMAAKFADLGRQRAAILSAREAYLRPDFQRQLGKSPDRLIDDGTKAMTERWGDV